MGIDTTALAGSHDLRLADWGPYSKRYIGISHIPDVSAGLRFDLSVFPGLYRRSVNVPNVRWDSGFVPWEAAPDLSYTSHRHEVLGQDQVYVDVAFIRQDESGALIRAELVNNTDAPQSLALHTMAFVNFPPLETNSDEALRPLTVSLPPDGVWIDGVDYADLHMPRPGNPQATLVYDGHLRGEKLAHDCVSGRCLANGFGGVAGDAVTYRLHLPHALPDAQLLIRYRRPIGAAAVFDLSGTVTGTITLPAAMPFTLHAVDVGALAAGEVTLTLTAADRTPLQIDGLALLPRDTADAVTFSPVRWNPVPARSDGPQARSLLLRYDHVDGVYGLAWGGAGFEVREFYTDTLDTWMRRMVHDHVHDVLRGPGEGHFTNVYQRPFFLPPRSRQTVYGLACFGEAESVSARLAAFDPDDSALEDAYAAARARAVTLPGSPAGEKYRFSQARMAATLLTNIVYPVRTRGTWIRHSTPGRWWDSLYTWDSGFIGLGLAELDVDRAVDNLNAYVTEPGTPDAAFIHHGSPVPTQFNVFWALWNRTQDNDLLRYFYPRLAQYHRFMAGRWGSSTTHKFASNLLQTWDYFYNTGWDDYPPQVYMHEHDLAGRTSAVLITAHVIRTAKMLHVMAGALGEDRAEYVEDIATFSAALHDHAWDDEAGVFSFVRHDEHGAPVGFLRHESGANFNLGLDGAAPLVAGICTPAQERRLVDALMNDSRLWTPYGLSTVDQSAPYYRKDGYWNGGVWMPHQWYFWQALLDMGRADEAFRIAKAALDVWQQEVDRSHRCFEHFLVENGRGAGWHQFGGLSAPVLAFYSAYFRPGRLTTGFDVWVRALDVAADGSALDADLEGVFVPPHHRPVVIVTVPPGAGYSVTWNGAAAHYRERVPGALEVQLGGAVHGRLRVRQF